MLPFPSGPFDIVIQNSTDTTITVAMKNTKLANKDLKALFLYYVLNGGSKKYCYSLNVTKMNFICLIANQVPAQKHTVRLQVRYDASYLQSYTKWSKTQTVWTLPRGKW